ncbi:MAG TPA: mandelate racemase/muconate lactonizing enzyme family protein [Casimicrobiaceae bacterium]|nr:mandelate racemase/muconate lactonizing enzyme family protein [Casimicrobiaceae bacterium]
MHLAKSSPIERIRWHQLRVSAKTVWSFVELINAEGYVGVGEATLGQHEPQMRAALASFENAVIGRAAEDVDLALQSASARSLPEFAVVSALDQAAWDLIAQARGIGVAAALGAMQRERVPAYANINRGMTSRTPQGFAAQARCAVADGFRAIKIAPFDEVELRGRTDAKPDAWHIDAGLARIGAVREAIGADVELMVDCHWRLNRDAAEAVLKEASPHNLYWLECPVPETQEMLATLAHLRDLANGIGVRLAGCEQMSLASGFAPFLRAGAYDVMMPDAKYVGGLREMLRVAQSFAAHGVAFSPHNPSGPVCHAVSLHVCAVVPALDRLEMQYAETSLFDELVDDVLPRAVHGEIEVPVGPGLGLRLNARLTRELASCDGFARHASQGAPHAAPGAT